MVVVAYKPMLQNMQVFQTVASNPCPHINAELLLVSRMDYAMKILLCTVVLDVNTHDAISTKGCLICKDH
jgi:hypothetical protein